MKKQRKNIAKTFKESWKRSLLKTATYRIAIIIMDFTAIYLFTKNIGIATGFVIISNIYTSLAYYGHERVWDAIGWGKAKAR